MMEERGYKLTGIVTDTDAPERMLDEMVRPLGVPILIIPAIELVDTEKGFVPIVEPVRFVGSLLKANNSLYEKREEYAAFFKAAAPGKVYCMFHVTLARFFQLNPLPASVKITHMAAQFGLSALGPEDMPTVIEVGTGGVMALMREIFEASGQVVPISPLGVPGTLPPIIHLPSALKPRTPKLILCYFLVATNAEKLDAILQQRPMPGVEFHCFTSKALSSTRSQLHSHAKQRKLFQELFHKCTGVIVSAGNETVWEAVCRGVPVLTIPTEGHGEQLLNAAVHGRNFPELVRQRPRLAPEDINWLVQFDSARPAAALESANLRKLVSDFQENGSPLFGDLRPTGGKKDKEGVPSVLKSITSWSSQIFTPPKS